MVLLKPEQERVKLLLKDTITLLCKNGLEFKDKFSVDAVIGVTVDENDVFLISMNEIIRSESFKAAAAAADQQAEEAEELKIKNSRKRRRKRPRVKKENSSGDDSDSRSGASDHSDGDDNDESNHSPEKKRLSGVVSKQEPLSAEEIDDEDIVVIKEEMDTWSESLQQHSSMDDPSLFQTNSGQSQDMSFGDMSFGVSEDNWSQAGPSQGHYRVGGSRSSTVTAGNMGQGDMSQGQGPQQVAGIKRKRMQRYFSCTFCSYVSRRMYNLKRHMKSVHAGMEQMNWMIPVPSHVLQPQHHNDDVATNSGLSDEAIDNNSFTDGKLHDDA